MLQSLKHHLGAFRWPFWALVSLTLVAGIAIVALIVVSLEQREETDARRHAVDLARALAVFQSLYSRDVVSRLDPETARLVTHDYRAQDGAIPLPATLSIELSTELSEKLPGSTFALVSRHPFPWRTDRSLSEFERTALDALQDGSREEFSQITAKGDARQLAVAMPLVMTESCVACHNGHTDSPKTDWRVGDVRGAQIVYVNLTEDVAWTDAGFLRILALLVIGGGAALSLVGYLVWRNFREVTATQNALRLAEESEARALSVLRSAADAIVTIDQSGRVEIANDAVKRIFGIDPDDLVGKNISCLMPQHEADRHDGFLKTHFETGRSTVIGSNRELRGRRVDGSVFPLELSVSKFEVAGKVHFTGIMRDVSERRRAERKAQAAEALLTEAIEALPDGFVLYDPDDRLVICNTKYREIYSTSQDLIVPGATFEEIIRGGANAASTP